MRTPVLKSMLLLGVLLALLVPATGRAVDDHAPSHPYSHRLIWMWERMDGRLEHVADKPSFFSREDMLAPSSVPRYVRFAELLHSMNINGLTVTVSFTGHGFMDILPQLRALSEFLRGYGIGLYLHVPYAHPARASARSNPNCPFAGESSDYWNGMADKLFAEVPLLKGYVMKGTGYEGIDGPLQCDCETCKSKTDQERMLAALRMLSRSVTRHRGMIFYRTWTTGALQDREFTLFSGLSGMVPRNVVLVSKLGYGDFGIKEIPHPLFGHVRPRTQHMAEFQIYGEYRGKLSNPCQMVTHWGDWLRKRGGDVDGLLGIVEVDRKWFDHPLNMVNWYAFGRFASDPSADPETVMREWAEKTFGKGAADAVVGLVKRTDTATRKLMYFKGIWVQEHGILPRLRYLDTRLRGPWPGLPRDEKRFGWGRPLDLFSRTDAERYARDPDFDLFLNRREITPELLTELSAQQDDAVACYREMLDYWQGCSAVIPRWSYARIERMLRASLADAEIWRANTRLYVNWLQGKDCAGLIDELERLSALQGTDLTRDRARAILPEYRGD